MYSRSSSALAKGSPDGKGKLDTSLLSALFCANNHLTVFPLAAWARKKIDKIRRSFLYKGEENANGRHCLVNWPIVTRPKDIGGLGIPDLEKFGRGLRLRWLGRNGPTIPNHGQVPNFLAVMMIASSLKPQPHDHDW
jgi:hypothetical protein